MRKKPAKLESSESFPRKAPDKKARSKKARAEVPWGTIDRVAYRLLCLGRVGPRIASAPRELVLLQDLTAIQRTVSVERFLQYVRNPALSAGRTNPVSGNPTDLPIVVRVAGELYVHDGHHRLAAAMARGAVDALARFVDLDSAAEKKPATKIQSLIFDKKAFSRAKAIAWAKTHDFKSGDVDETDQSYRLRQRDPRRFQPRSFRTIKLTKGVSAVIGRLK